MVIADIPVLLRFLTSFQDVYISPDNGFFVIYCSESGVVLFDYIIADACLPVN